ncbi:hypothetical protein BJ546DRAFT_211209 [Cryomyces antarcticus]
MSGVYNPGDSAKLVEPWITALLSERDTALQVPVNYVTNIGIFLTTACFAHNRYHDADAALCFSNLLATGFRKFVVDLYWDSARHVWSLCPAQVPGSSSQGDVSTASLFPTSSVSLGPLSTAQLSGRAPLGTHARSVPESTVRAFVAGHGQARRQGAVSISSVASVSSLLHATTTVSVQSNASSFGNGTTSSTSFPQPTPTGTPTSGSLLYGIGPYLCSPTVDFSLIISVLSDYLGFTETTLAANIGYLILNLHVAAPLSSPTDPAEMPRSSDLPTAINLLSTLVNTNLSSYLYTPAMLQHDRMNLNTSWYRVSNSSRPDASYYSTDVLPGDVYSTPDGWPSESYIEFEKAKRLFVGYGSIDPQMVEYNFTGDSSTIFPQYELQSVQNVTISSTGEVTAGCVFNPGQTSLSAVNSSWALSSDMSIFSPASGSLNASTNSIANLTACGITAVMNVTLLNTTADTNILPYRDMRYSSVWSWAPSEPRNDSARPNNDAPFRCAMFDTNGRWHVAGCATHSFAACRDRTQPFSWTISGSRGSYSSANDACPSNSTFAVPRTALENSYLLSAFHRRDDAIDDQQIWLNFNALDAQNCWVSGVNTTCPYTPSKNSDPRRTIVVPTVAAVIVFLLAALTLFVKCAANRQNSRRRRRRGEDGWDYEGVPS